MTAVVILLELPLNDSETAPNKEIKTPPKSPEETREKPLESTPTTYPPFRPIPVGLTSVFGKKTFPIGHFDTMSLLMKELETLPSTRRTVYATVGDFSGLRSKTVRRQLSGLPDELTILVGRGKSHV